MITLFQHQQQALDETEGKNRVAYYLDMGLGKPLLVPKNDEAGQADQSGGVPMFKGSRLD